MIHLPDHKLDKIFETIGRTDIPVQLTDARMVIGELVELLRPACERIEIAGSVRRNKPEVHDAEVVIIPTPDLLPLTDTLIEYGTAQYALYGEKRTKRWGNNYRGLLFKGIKCELFMTTEESWGYQFWLRTGPGDANTLIMRWLGLPYMKAPVRFQGGYGWYSRNWTHNGKTWIAVDKQRLRIASEEDLFAVLGLPFKNPNAQSRFQEQVRKVDLLTGVQTTMRNLQAAGIAPTSARNSVEDVNVFRGALQDALDNFQKETKRPPDLKEQKEIGSRLVQEVVNPDSFWQKTFGIGGKSPVFLLPVPEAVDKAMIQEDEARGVTTTPEQRRQRYVSALYRELLTSGAAKAMK